jgi:hypothetical protein
MATRLAKPKKRTAAPSDLVSVKVRMKESQRRIYQAEAERDGISINQVIERRLGRTLLDEKMTDLIERTSKAAAWDQYVVVKREMASQLRELEGRIGGHILNLQHFITLKKEQ